MPSGSDSRVKTLSYFPALFECARDYIVATDIERLE